MAGQTISKRVRNFQNDLRALSSRQVFRKHLLDGSPYALNADESLRLRESICEKFQVEFSDVVIVGSGKLGFTIKPDQKFRRFNEDSDIDVAVVSTQLFDKVWKDALLYAKSGAYWTRKAEFFKYLSKKGWVRPDMLPPSESYDFSKSWFHFFDSELSKSNICQYKVTAGLYHSWFFLEEYQKDCIEKCNQEA